MVDCARRVPDPNEILKSLVERRRCNKEVKVGDSADQSACAVERGRLLAEANQLYSGWEYKDLICRMIDCTASAHWQGQ